MIFDDDYSLARIPPILYKKIISSMDYDDSWKKIQKCKDLYEVIKPPAKLGRYESASEFMLNILIEKLCTMGNLREILLKSELYEPLSLFYTEQLRILKQPAELLQKDELLVKRKNSFSLEFSVWGIPQPNYQWYKDEKILAGQTAPKLFYKSYSSEMEGVYYCEAEQIIEDFRSNTKRINKVESDKIKILTKQEKCIITRIPLKEICCKMGDPDILLEIIADGFPEPKYQWSHDNQLLNNMKNRLQIPTQLELTGVYRCYISNGINSLIVSTTVKIVDPNFKFPVCLQPVVEKVALLIGNENYSHQQKLTTPNNDTKALQNKLESIGFLVLNINNLTLNGMINAVKYFSEKMCCKDCIALFYYAGHGFEFGEKYLMPIDVPDTNNYKMKNCVSEYRIFEKILGKEPKLLVVLLDMCLIFPKRDENPGIFEETKQIHEFECKRNLLRGYATSTGYISYEMDKIKHSVYNCLLQDHITTKVPILQMLGAIHAEFEEHAKASGNMKIAKQMPSITHNLSQDYYLNVEKTGYPAAKANLDSIQGFRKPRLNIT